ncbi:hypothetical protein [Roseateles albus]|uniref:Uncharacterized protein n=1 Tax=Roseateles albus TaxID=2987525 RepID=A0ABT5KL46_9BURK|nr:hypothetical protein [Roseateles albus]MDC8773551.1 hypothetical protein [Roseateles albus]
MVAEISAVEWVGPEFQVASLPRTCVFKNLGVQQSFLMAAWQWLPPIS